MEQGTALKIKLFSPEQIAAACVFGTFVLAAIMLCVNRRRVKPDFKFANGLELFSAALFGIFVLGGVYKDSLTTVFVGSVVAAPSFYTVAREVINSKGLDCAYFGNIAVLMLILLSIAFNVILISTLNSI